MTTVKASEIKFYQVPGDCIRRKSCGCRETKITMFGFSKWVLDIDGMCSRHKKEHLRGFASQHRERVEIDKKKRKKKRTKVREE